MLIENKSHKIKYLAGLCMLFSMAAPSYSQSLNLSEKNKLGHSKPSYDDIISIVDDSNLVVDITIKKIRKFPDSQTIGVPINRKRLLITASVQSLIRGQTGINSEIKFLYDAPIDSRGKVPKLKKQRILAFGRNVKNRSDFIKLTHIDSIMIYSPQTDNIVRSAIREVIAPNAPQKITGISSGFHSPGTIIGEGETQIFLDTEFGQPMAISITSSPGQEPRWSVSTTEVIDINATEAERNSLLGHRLACSLPSGVPANVVESGTVENQRKVSSDYTFVKQAIGPCNKKIIWGQ